MCRTPWGKMTVRTLLFITIPSSALILSRCGYGNSNTCSIKTSISPTTATADHAATPPGNQAQFMLSDSVSGNCPLIGDSLGTWSTSDPADTTLNTITAQPGANVTATCVHAAPAPVTISNSGTIRGKLFPSATLTCN